MTSTIEPGTATLDDLKLIKERAELVNGRIVVLGLGDTGRGWRPGKSSSA